MPTRLPARLRSAFPGALPALFAAFLAAPVASGEKNTHYSYVADLAEEFSL